MVVRREAGLAQRAAGPVRRRRQVAGYARAVIRPVSNPPNPWQGVHVEWLGEPPPALPVVHEEQAKSILSENDSPDLPFRWSLNPYRGCHHGCAYCYARPTHEYLGWGAGTDFERQLVVKTNAPELLTRAFARRSWRGERIAFSGVTDCYQPLEAEYGLTRACLEVCLEHRNPVVIVTKGALVRRDVDLLARLAEEAWTAVHLSIPFADEATSSALEPGASSVAARFAALETLASAGVPVGVSVSPLIPGLNDKQVPEILERAKAAGAQAAWSILLRLPGSVRPVFQERIAEAVPGRAKAVLSALTEMGEGKLSRPGFGHRMKGSGARWQAMADLFALHCRRLGLAPREESLEGPGGTFRRPTGGQGQLFET
jgi:DNA repair photolyase